MSSMSPKYLSVMSKWCLSPKDPGPRKEPSKVSFRPLSMKFAFATTAILMVDIQSPFAAADLTETKVKSSNTGESLQLLHEQIDGQGQVVYPNVGDVSKDGWMDKEMVDMIDQAPGDVTELEVGGDDDKLADVGETTKYLVTADSRGITEEVGSGRRSGLGLEVSPTYPDFLQDTWWGCKATQDMCDRCSRNCGCKTGNCSWNYVCYSGNRQGANGCLCKFDSDCQSGRCASNFACAPKLEDGNSCFEDDDCASGFCGWDFVCHPHCKGRKDIPFMVTNVDLTKEGSEYFWGYHSDDTAGQMQFLKNIKYCPDAGTFYAYRIYGELISPEEFKKELEKFVNTGGIDHVLYNIHGVTVDPESSFMGAHDFNENHSVDTGYLVIPINWRSHWGTHISLIYEQDRNNAAPDAGRHLAAKIDVFKSSISTSMMSHSMGTYVTRIMAQNVDSPEEVFENLFLVAPDSRMDMFSTDFNPGAENEESTDPIDVLDEQVFLDIPDDELKENGGYAITKLVANKTHVIWNGGDLALAFREIFQIPCLRCLPGTMDHIRKALGKFGGDADELMTLPYFKERVAFYDFSRFGSEHNYQWFDPLVELYKEHKSDKTTNVTDTAYSKSSTPVTKGGLRVN